MIKALHRSVPLSGRLGQIQSSRAGFELGFASYQAEYRFKWDPKNGCLVGHKTGLESVP